jgi:uncharacterized protein
VDEATLSVEEKTKALRDAYDGLNRNDISAFTKSFDPQVEWIELIDLPTVGRHVGLEAVKAYVIRSRERWAEGSCEPERFLVAGDKMIVFVNVRVRLKDETDWREGQTADVYTFRGDKVVEGRVFIDRQQALEWVGMKTSD